MSSENDATGAEAPKGGNVTETAESVLTQAQQAVSAIADQAREQVATRIGEQKRGLADGFGSVAKALHAASDSLGEEHIPFAPSAVNYVAGQAEALATYLGERDFADFVDDAEDYARSRPALFVGGAFVVGLLTARFLKSSRGKARTTVTARRRRPTLEASAVSVRKLRPVANG